ncbi:MAG TPA: metallophosphoesterase family protein [Thermodesulfobacteriota bacterium]|jgi:predicted phosphodiesterase|nr:metallophosphoesterase family protein [Thermodesulfobacteriota bacterium]
MDREELFEKAGSVLEKEPRLIHLPSLGKTVFVGDTHGDLDASQQIIRQYLKKPYHIVFLGDYVDRGHDSRENIQYLLGLKWEHPEEIFLLAGNHEGFMVKEFYPCNFWSSISSKEKEEYGLLFSKLPLAASTGNGLLALHGALPDLKSLEEMNQIELGDENWDRVVWADFVENEMEILGDLWGRPQFGRAYFERLMERYQKQVLIRSHQPHAPLTMFKKRCITIFTSHAYLPIRTIAIVDLEKEIRTAEDVVLERI